MNRSWLERHLSVRVRRVIAGNQLQPWISWIGRCKRVFLFCHPRPGLKHIDSLGVNFGAKRKRFHALRLENQNQPVCNLVAAQFLDSVQVGLSVSSTTRKLRRFATWAAATHPAQQQNDFPLIQGTRLHRLGASFYATGKSTTGLGHRVAAALLTRI